MKIIRKGSAAWQGGFKDGKGTISTESGALKAYPYGFAARFEGQRGSNPEELIAAAHASCFTMALSLILGEAKLTAEQMDTTNTEIICCTRAHEGFGPAFAMDKALVRGLAGAAAQHGVVTVSSLEHYLKHEVKRVTHDKEHVTLAKPALSSLPLAIG